MSPGIDPAPLPPIALIATPSEVEEKIAAALNEASVIGCKSLDDYSKRFQHTPHVVLCYGKPDAYCKEEFQRCQACVICILPEEMLEWGMHSVEKGELTDFLPELQFHPVLLKTCIRRAYHHFQNIQQKRTFNELYISILFNSLDPILIIAPDHSLFMNPCLAKMLGYSENTVEVSEFFLNGVEDVERSKQSLVLLDAKGGRRRIGIKHLHHTAGNYRLITFESEKDAEFRKQKQIFLEENRKFRLAAKTSKLGVWNLDFNKEYVRFDEGVSAIYGLPVDYPHLSRIRWRLFLHPSDEYMVMKAFKEAREFRDTLDIQYRIIDIHNQVKYLRLSAEVRKDKTGKRIGMIGLAVDITDYVERGKSIQEQNDKLREIAWAQSHIVRAPLAQIMGLIDIISFLEGEDQTRALSEIMKSANDLDSIVRQLIDSAAQVDSREKTLKS